MNVAAALERGAAVLASSGVEAPRLDAEVLLAYALETSRGGLVARAREAVSIDAWARYDDALTRRGRREPVAYILGGREFWSLWLEVTPDTLVPRPETEVLVESCLALLEGVDCPSILDLGTGSGCVAIALASERPDARITAIDVSNAALAVARRNALRHGVEKHIRFECADARSFIPSSPVDLVAGNLPYVVGGDIDALQPEVSCWEPRLALDGGVAGLALIDAVLRRAPLLARGGRLALEIGCEQAEAALALARAAGCADASIRPDYAGLPRVLVGMVPATWRASLREARHRGAAPSTASRNAMSD